MFGGLKLDTPEAPLWAFLDRLDLPFRTPLAVLLAQHGQQPGSANWLSDCVLPGKTLLRGLSPFAVQVREGDDPTLPPVELVAAYRSGRTPTDWLMDRRVYRNFDRVLQAVQAELGPGENAASSNTRAREWRYGMARLSVTVFPPALNPRRGNNVRYAADPGARHECSLRINPGWLPDLSAAQLAMVAEYHPIGAAMEPFFGRYHMAAPWHRWPAGAGPRPVTGYGPAAGGAGLVIVAGDLVHAIPRADLQELSREVLMPARGPGQVDLSVRYAPAGLTGVRPHLLVLARTQFERSALLAEGQALAAALDIPLRESVGNDA